MSSSRRPSVPATAVAASPIPSDRVLKSRYSDQSIEHNKKTRAGVHKASQKLDSKKDSGRPSGSGTLTNAPIINISVQNSHLSTPTSLAVAAPGDLSDAALADELDYITVTTPAISSPNALAPGRADKASRILGIRHRRSMEPIPASTRNSIVSTRSLRDAPPLASYVPTLPLTSLYVVSGLPKSPHTWTLADPDSVLGLHHSESAVNRWWRPEVLGSTVSPGAGGGKKKKRGKNEETLKGAGALSKQEVGKMLSKALKLSFTREVEVIASTLQPASTVHTFTFTLPAPNTPLAPTPSGDLLRASVLSNTDNRSSAATFAYPYTDDPFARPSSAYLGPPSLLGHGSHSAPTGVSSTNAASINPSTGNTVTYHGVCLTVWSHADAERSTAIRRTLEAGRSRKESAQSVVASRLKNLRADVSGSTSDNQDPTTQARRSAKRSSRGPWADAETDGETEADGAMSESDFEVASTVGHGPGESTLFLPGDTVFWLPYALTLVSRHPVYDLMRDYLTLSWARFSKDVQSHTLQISKILAHPAPRAGDLIKLDASPKSDGSDSNLEVIARFPGGLDFGRGLVDINFTMWPLFKCLNLDNILTICEIALAPTGRVVFFSRYPAMLGIAVSTIKYLVELRAAGMASLCLQFILVMQRFISTIRVCVCDLDINYLSCPSPPPNCVSVKQQRDKYRQRLLTAFESYYHPDHSVPSEFKEAFPAGRFRPVCKIQAKRGASSAAVADQIKPPEWWHSTRIIQAFDSVLADKFKKPSFLKRISMFGTPKRPPQLTAAEQLIQHSIRKRATAFVDARDDLETKIGRLSRRLNFLMTESDLWRDKFVTFEQYAEKLSAEANQLRTKINKEQRETKRLSGLVTLTAVEKTKLQTQLRETETAQREAALELERMRETMERMEQERAEMVAEVEAQIERALASMAVELDDSDYGSSRPQSRLSNVSGSRSRRTSDASKARHLRSFGTESTLAESYAEDIEAVEEEETTETIVRETSTIAEDEEELTTKKKRFSASELEVPQDGMNAVDEGISQKSDKIAQKLESALSSDRRVSKWKSQVESGEESLSEVGSTRSRRSRTKRPSSKPSSRPRTRSGTMSSTQTSTPTIKGEDSKRPPLPPVKPPLALPTEQDTKTPTRASFLDVSNDDHSTPESIPSPLEPDTTSLEQNIPQPPPPPMPITMTDDSDTDFQSAYSASPRGSYGSFDSNEGFIGAQNESTIALDNTRDENIEDRLSAPPKTRRERVSSTSTAIVTRDNSESRPTPNLIPTRNRVAR
ncbi:hypothetical protein M413DRAFT_22737 [Hebeloma cylindrosporum]|uniref:cDENN domain-containing protein n=1 Tax=Hebeloma cylindrosporum TaxID=76867 RepID=A0A0C3CWJ6_HEBCY|nr:hypothetical protein M413DRAFT_22737 [Hebeloma cylindrosporum h7]